MYSSKYLYDKRKVKKNCSAKFPVQKLKKKNKHNNLEERERVAVIKMEGESN